MKNLLGSNKFKFNIIGSRFKNNEFDPMIYSINIPGITLGNIVQTTSMRGLNRPGDSLEFNDLNITFILQENLSDWLTIFNWIMDCRNPTRENIEEIYTNGILNILTNKNNPSITFTFERMFPYSISDIPLSNAEALPSIQCDVSFKYINMKYQII